MVAGYRNSAGVDADDLYDPDVIGDGLTAGDRKRPDGTPLRYALAKYGTPGPVIDQRDIAGADFGPRWCKKGTASYNDAVAVAWGQYNADSHGSHDAGAALNVQLKTDGTIAATLTSLQGGASGGLRSGAWHKSPAAGIGAYYEVRFTANITVDSFGEAGDPSYTPSTGWLPLSSVRAVVVDTGHLLGGGADSGTVRLSGSYLVEIRKIGNASIVSSTMGVSLRAMV